MAQLGMAPQPVTLQEQQEASGTTWAMATLTSTAAKTVSILSKCKQLTGLDGFEQDHEIHYFDEANRRIDAAQ